jgi:hypothetical protein
VLLFTIMAEKMAAAASGFDLATSLPSIYWSHPFEAVDTNIEKKVAKAAERARAFATIETTAFQSPEKASAARTQKTRGKKRVAQEITPDRQDDQPPLTNLNRFLLTDIIKVSNAVPSVPLSLLVVKGHPLYDQLKTTTKHAVATIRTKHDGVSKTRNKASSKEYLVIPGCTCASKLPIDLQPFSEGTGQLQLTIKLTSSSVRVKFTDIETGDLMFWGATTNTSRFFEMLKEKHRYDKKSIEQRNCIVSRLLDELLGDSIQTFELVSVFYLFATDENQRANEENERAKAAAKCKPPPSPLATPVVVKDMTGKLLSETEGIEQFLLDADEFFRKRLKELCSKDFRKISFTVNDPFDKDIENLVEMWKTAAPIHFGMQLSKLIGKKRYKGKTNKERMALWLFFCQQRVSNNTCLTFWAKMYNNPHGMPAAFCGRALDPGGSKGQDMENGDMTEAPNPFEQLLIGTYSTVVVLFPFSNCIPRYTLVG